MNNSENPVQKKKRIRRSPEKMAELVLEAERIGQSKVCKREGIAPAQLSRRIGQISTISLRNSPPPFKKKEALRASLIVFY